MLLEQLLELVLADDALLELCELVLAEDDVEAELLELELLVD